MASPKTKKAKSSKALAKLSAIKSYLTGGSAAKKTKPKNKEAPKVQAKAAPKGPSKPAAKPGKEVKAAPKSLPVKGVKALDKSPAKVVEKAQEKLQEKFQDKSSKKPLKPLVEGLNPIAVKSSKPASSKGRMVSHGGSTSSQRGKSKEESICREVACEGLSTTAGYCRLHYIKNWKKIKRKELILKEGKLNQYIEELVSKYPDKYIEAIRQDLANDKDFSNVVTDLELDESLEDFDTEGESVDNLIDNIRRDVDDEGDVY